MKIYVLRKMKVQPQFYNPYSTQTYTQTNYNNLLQKYESLKQEYSDLQKVGFSKASLENLRRELVEKENKLKQLRGMAPMGYGSKNLNTQYNDLKNENKEINSDNIEDNNNNTIKNGLNSVSKQ